MQILKFICIFSEKRYILSFELCFEPVLKTLSGDHCLLLSVSHLYSASHPCEEDLTGVTLAKDNGY